MPVENSIVQADYPLSFRASDCEALGLHLKNRHSVQLIGMRRVGISNFVKFFIYKKGIAQKYIGDNKNHLFIQVELNDLVEIGIFPFWVLTFKRIVDSVSDSSLTPHLKKEIEGFFLDSISHKDLFLTLEGIRKALSLLVEAGYTPTIFFNRFDRIIEAATPAFFSNLEGLKINLSNAVSIVLTSQRSLDTLKPEVFTKTFLSVFCHNLCMKPALYEDAKVISDSYNTTYKLALSPQTEKTLFEITGGHIQYLQFALILLHEQKKSIKDTDLFNLIASDERITLQSEELWESLTPAEQEIILKIRDGQSISDQEWEQGKYLTESGFLVKDQAKYQIFSPLFEHFLKLRAHKSNNGHSSDLTKKEQTLYDYLLANIDQICPREKIIEAVWPEYEEIGVSDWTIDRLVARLRSKLRTQKNEFQIITVKTRGYKLSRS